MRRLLELTPAASQRPSTICATINRQRCRKSHSLFATLDTVHNLQTQCLTATI